jgi:hypothetical protein
LEQTTVSKSGVFLGLAVRIDLPQIGQDLRHFCVLIVMPSAVERAVYKVDVDFCNDPKRRRGIAGGVAAASPQRK